MFDRCIVALQKMCGPEVQGGGGRKPGVEAIRHAPVQGKPAEETTAGTHPALWCKAYIFLLLIIICQNQSKVSCSFWLPLECKPPSLIARNKLSDAT